MAEPFHILTQIFKLLVFPLLITSCTSSNTLPVQGHYASKQFSGLERFLTRPFYHFSVGMKLDVRNDSTFRLEMCGNVETGMWKINQDSLILIPLTNKTNGDSLPLNLLRFSYKIKRNGELKHFIYTDDDSKLLDQLVKVEKE
jgi:hypothetical protein